MTTEVTPVAPTTPTAPVAPAAPAVTVTPAAPVAPVAPVTPAAASEFSYDPTGDASIDYALSFIGKAGLDADHPAMVAADSGDFSLLKAELAQKGVAGWEQVSALLEQGYERVTKAEEAQLEAIGTSLLEQAAALGVDWTAAVSWASKNASQEEGDVLAEMLQDPIQAKIAGFYIASTFASQGERKPETAVGTAPATTAAPVGTLTRIQFSRESEKLYRQFGQDYQKRPEYAALRRRLS